MHLFLATDLTAIPGYTGPETDERIEVRRMTLADAVAMAARVASRMPRRCSRSSGSTVSSSRGEVTSEATPPGRGSSRGRAVMPQARRRAAAGRAQGQAMVPLMKTSWVV